MNEPPSPDQGVIFGLASVAEELRGEPAYARDGHTARTLVRTADLRVIVLALQAGTTLSEHHASTTASVQVLSGQVRLQLPDRAVTLAAGELLVLGSGLRHDVRADVESSLLLTLGWPKSE